MFTTNDYFDSKKIKTSYGSTKEHLEDCSLLIDFILENSVEKIMSGGGRIYRPGMMLGQEDVGEFYDIPPRTRRKSAYDPDLAKELSDALDHIRSREKASKKLVLPLKRLREEFELTFFEELAILLALGLSTNINRRNLYAYIANDASLKHPTTGVLYCIYQMICEDQDLTILDSFVDKLGKMSVFFFRAMDSTTGKTSLLDTPLVLKDDVQRYILSDAEFHHPIPYTCGYAPGKENLEIFKDAIRPGTEGKGLVYVASTDPDDVPAFLVRLNEKGVLVLDADTLFVDVKKSKNIYYSNTFAHALGGLFLRARLTGETLAIRLTNPDQGLCEFFFDVIMRFLPGKMSFVYGQDKLPTIFLSNRYNISSIALPMPDVEEREAIWKHFLQKEGLSLSEDINISDLADCYELSYSRIRYAVKETAKKARWQGREKIDATELKEELRRMGEAGLMDLAVYIPAVYTMEELQVEDLDKRIIMTACNRFKMRNRVEKKNGIKRSGAYGNGVSVLLCGPPGTGKTMAAQVISKELSLPLYRVDLSQIISKYIGETQKNLNEIFEHAKKTNVILFFDEADALFAKRTEVSDSNDKYANAETAYLLQKVEGHSGMTILATNLIGNFDSAFLRRITYVVKLQKPDVETRLSLWRSILPKSVEVDPKVDFEFFAENFDLSGSNIKAVLYSAMYMAAAEGRPVDNGDIVRAIRLRSEKIGSMNDPGEFGKYAGYLV